MPEKYMYMYKSVNLSLDVCVYMILVTALYNCNNYCHQSGLRKLKKKLRTERKIEKAITVKKKDISRQI